MNFIVVERTIVHASIPSSSKRLSDERVRLVISESKELVFTSVDAGELLPEVHQGWQLVHSVLLGVARVVHLNRAMLGNSQVENKLQRALP